MYTFDYFIIAFVVFGIWFGFRYLDPRSCKPMPKLSLTKVVSRLTYLFMVVLPLVGMFTFFMLVCGHGN